MVSSLAVQLAKGTSLNASLLADRSRRRHAESYLFTSREADQHDFHSIYALGTTGLSKLKTLHNKFAKYDENLFSDTSREFDRTLRSASETAKLDRNIRDFFGDLGPYLLEAPSSKALEWLVRRFKVNEYNLDDVMALFLPYHDTPHFAKMVSIMHVTNSGVWSFLSPIKTAGKSLPRSILVDEMVKNVDLAQFVVQLLPDALTSGNVHRTLVGFTAGVTVDYLTRLGRIQESIIVFVLPAAIRSFAADSNADCALAGYLTLATLSQHCHLSPEALTGVVVEMLKGQRHISVQQLISLLIAFLAPQDALDQFSDSITNSILHIPGAADSLVECLQWLGVEKLVLPLLPRLLHRATDETSFNLLHAILSSCSTSNAIIERCTLHCIDKILNSSSKSGDVMLRLLSIAYQRHSAVLSHAYNQQLKAELGKNRSALENIFRSISLPPSSSASHRGKWIISSQAADVENRVMAVRELLKALVAGDTGGDLYEALRSRLTDTSLRVIETLYSEPQSLLPVLSDLNSINSISKALAIPDAPRSVMRLHFAFIANEICAHSSDVFPAVFERIYLPHILFTKPRQKTAALVWQTLRQSKFSDYELLAGCIDLVYPRPEDEGASRSVDEMATLNLAVMAKIAGNIVTSNLYHRHLSMLLGLLASSDAHTTVTAYLLVRSLLDQLSGEHRVDVANRVLKAMNLSSLDTLHDVVSNGESLQKVIADDSLSRGVVLKPSSTGTVRRLQAAILALLPVVPRPVGAKIDWLGVGSSVSPDTRGERFVELAREVYTLVNSSSASQSLSTSILRALFINLREDTLLFLAGIWSSSTSSEVDLNNLRLVALFHGASFLKAQSSDVENPQDFQVVLPSLLIALQSRQRSVREAAMDCVSIIAQSVVLFTTSPTIYAFDAAYGNNSDLQYLEKSDFGRYVAALQSRKEHFKNDAKYLGIFHQEILGKETGDGKKETGYKHRVLCYILSHTITWSSLGARVALLCTLANVSNAAKLQMLLPLIQQLIPESATTPQLKDDSTFMWHSYCQTLLLAFDQTTAADLNEAGNGSYTTLLRLLRSMLSTGTPSSVCETLMQQLRTGLFDLLILEHKLDICVVLVKAAATQTDNSLVKDTLGAFLVSPSLITALLAKLQPIGADASQRATKRVKIVSESEDTSTEQSLQHLTVLVEVLVAKSLPGSLEVMSGAIDVLTRVFHIHSSKFDVNYLMQSLMSMLEAQASSLVGISGLSSGSVRMEILVELLRVSDNPQTFNQALLLIASLARLSPEFVMQNVMPVFTFMGSNVFHRDDSYSFRVVQKTVESIVPVMINSLKSKHIVPLEIQIASREFLRVFTDASTHVPRHRRTQFFNHLVEVLGPEEFTVSICLLLVDKVVNRVIRQKPGDIANALSLPLTIVQANFKATPFKIIEQLLHESSRLLQQITKPETAVCNSFLEPHTDGEQTTSTSAKRQIQAILIFVDFVLQQSSRKVITSDGDAVEKSVQILLELSELGHGSIATPEFPDISCIALKALGHLLRVISAVEFASSISTIIATKNPTVESGAMSLFSSRLINITPKTRQEISSTIIIITEHVCESLTSSQDLSTLQADLKALSAVAKTVVNDEKSVLTKAVPLVLQVATRERSLTAEALSCILPLSAAIGPRILPVFRDVVGFCCNALSQAGTLVEDGKNHTEEDAQSALVALLSSLSQFWGIDELIRLAALSLGPRPVCLVLRRTLAKRIPAKQALPALLRVWSDVATEADSERFSRQEAFFDLFKRVVRRAPREDVHEHLRQTFKLFLDAFDIAGERQGTEEAEASENATFTAFVEVVTKLNEAAFKPLFRRFFDWAFSDDAQTSLKHDDATLSPSNSGGLASLSRRQVTFCRALTALIKLLKGLITPYMSIVLTPLTEKLDSSRGKERTLSPKLWRSGIELFQASLEHDEGTFWRSDKLQKLLPTLVAQIDLCASLYDGNILKTCLGILAAKIDDVDDAALLKTVNLQILMRTRADDAQVRRFALECAGHIWHGSGDKLAGFVSDVVTFIAEAAEDEHDDVAREARRFRRTVEGRCGSLDALMQ